jgi:hypothetical protein
MLLFYPGADSRRRDTARLGANRAKTWYVLWAYFVGLLAGALRVVGNGWQKSVSL